MNAWTVRGLGMGLTHVLVRVFLAVGLAVWPIHGSIFKFIGVVVVVAVAIAWGWRDATDSEVGAGSGTDLTMTWIKAGAVAAFGSAIICWILSFIPGLDAAANGFFGELTSGAAFTFLITVIPALAAAGIAGLLARRRGGPDDAAAEPAAAGAAASEDDYPTEYIPQVDQYGNQVDDGAETTVFPAVDPQASTEQWSGENQR
ncbi:MAG: B-4DMT family transporter [Rhodococcus sp.]|nr:B-4DMT family transporter [Rhodococcus sp. (in: high G+C Gram-positive bacteria)]